MSTQCLICEQELRPTAEFVEVVDLVLNIEGKAHLACAEREKHRDGAFQIKEHQRPLDRRPSPEI